MKQFVSARMFFVFDDARDFGNYISSALHLHPIANLQPEALLDLIIGQRLDA